MPDRLENLLRTADRSAPESPSSPADMISALMARLEPRDPRPRGFQLVVACGVILILSGVLIQIIFRARHSAQLAIEAQRQYQTTLGQHPAVTPAGPDPTLAATNHELRTLETRLAALEGSERLAQNRARLAALSAIPTEQSLVERAASAVLRQADRWSQDAPAHSLAHDAYRRVIRTFPDTAAARIARQRLNTNDSEGKEG